MGLPFMWQVAITIPDGFTVREADADGAGIHLLAFSDSEARILTYSADGGAPQHSLEIAFDETWQGLVSYGDGWVVAGLRRLVSFSRLGVEGESGGNDFQFSRIWSADWDEREDRFVAWGTQGRQRFNSYNLQVRTFDKDFMPHNLASSVLADRLPLSDVYCEPGFMTQHGAQWIFVSPNGADQRVVITDENFVEVDGETQALPSDPLRGLASRHGQLVMVTEGQLHFYGAEVLPLVGERHEQIPFDTDYFQQYSIARPTNPIQVIAFDEPMVMNRERGYQERGPDGTIEKVVEPSIRVIPQMTVPGVEEGDRVFPHTGAAGVAPTAIPDDAWIVHDLDLVGNVLQQQIYCRD